MPCKKRAMIKVAPFTANAASNEVTTTLAVPIRKIRLRPTRSERRPNSKTNIALAIKNAIGIQPTVTASSRKSSAISGKATFEADSIIGVANAFNNTIASVYRCSDRLSDEALTARCSPLCQKRRHSSFDCCSFSATTRTFIAMRSNGLSRPSRSTATILSATSMPSTTSPKTVY